MRSTLLAAGGFALYASLIPAPPVPQACDSSPLRIQNVDVWTAANTLRRRDVLVRDGRIAAIEPTRRGNAGGIATIDGTGHTLLPDSSTPTCTSRFRAVSRQNGRAPNLNPLLANSCFDRA